LGAGSSQSCASRDTDGDGIPDSLDTDSDNDGCPDAVEAAGGFILANLDANNRFLLPVGTGATDNGVPIIVGNGQATTAAVTTTGPDGDSDGVPDTCDLDSDGDGVSDTLDICPGGNDAADIDNDGVPDFQQTVLPSLQIKVSM